MKHLTPTLPTRKPPPKGTGFKQGGKIMSAFVEWHKNYMEWGKKKFGISDYVVIWGTFFKGLVVGLLIYYFFIKL